MVVGRAGVGIVDCHVVDDDILLQDLGGGLLRIGEIGGYGDQMQLDPILQHSNAVFNANESVLDDGDDVQGDVDALGNADTLAPAFCCFCCMLFIYGGVLFCYFMTIVTWNIQGAAGRHSLRALKDLCRHHKSMILVLIETKISGPRADVISLSLGFGNWVRVEATGLSGGIWIFWNTDVVSVSVIYSHSQFIHCLVENVSCFKWFFSTVYASPREHLRPILFFALTCITALSVGPWLLVGDFNPYAELSERSKFTWWRGRSTEICHAARLDRMFCNRDWTFLFPYASVLHLERAFSDHCPLLLRLDLRDISRHPQSFRFQAAWFQHPAFFETRRLLARLRGVQEKLCSDMHQGLISLYRKLRIELEQLLDQEEMLWFQKSREKRITEGERNTAFFHASVAIKGNKKRVARLPDENGQWITDPDQIMHMALQFFTKLYSEHANGDLTRVPSSAFLTLSQDDIALPSADFQMTEIKDALFSMDPYKV
ncbi:uncharacterized protein LOC110643786 [Hevea brasiliensis]|uniref:uncharacterized protein LOC110643786 n=1 Tax=Hevea brasiliensis TaxID=3981 RepID=UPI0025E24FD3|nr:uncharacterized protein LOC110643786 [Hevea brasiliensis]